MSISIFSRFFKDEEEKETAPIKEMQIPQEKLQKEEVCEQKICVKGEIMKDSTNASHCYLGLTDEPITSIEHESFGIQDYVGALSEFIEDCQTPMTISIQADWGSGKTSMMNMIKQKLIHSPKIADTIWFNTWQFSQFNTKDDLNISFLSHIVKEIGGGDDKSETMKILGNVAKRVAGAGVHILGGALGGGGEKAASLLLEEVDSSEQISKLKKKLEDIVIKKTQANSSRIIVFIDDLDRLMPKKAVELLEVMKLFLDVPNCVFVLAVDYNVVVSGLKEKFGSGINDEKAKSFFDKIIQLPFNLPVATYDVHKYFKSLLTSHNNTTEYKEGDIESFVDLVNNSVGFNPRSMKRLFNALELLKMVAKSKNMLAGDENAKTNEKERILFATLCLQSAYDGVYRYFLTNQNHINSEFFDILTNGDKFSESDMANDFLKALKVKNTESEEFLKFVEFINALMQALHLESNKKDALSEIEINTFLQFLNFSSITTNSNAPKVSVNTHEDWQKGNFDYWSKFVNEITALGSKLYAGRAISKDNWASSKTVISHCLFESVLLRKNKKVHGVNVRFLMKKPVEENIKLYEHLLAHKEELESAMGGELDFYFNNGKRSAVIFSFKDIENLDEVITKNAEIAYKMEQVLVPYLKGFK
ncbi:DUF4268 domain-containing protein [Helicobacter cetorum]|uniref:DUF4268 domain-containing protein n=1 Tax=Helicobacter cetorum TaxID=138563 RepID=UPI000CF18CF3|nr:DUF4268 domain-containing protein [Helicobacter cetorum]